MDEVMIKVSTAGSFPFPRVVVAGARVSVRKLGDAMRNLLHDRDGALADERDRHRVGATRWRAAQRAAWEALQKVGLNG